VAQQKPDPSTVETGEQVYLHDRTTPAVRPMIDGLDAGTEALRHAAEDTPYGHWPWRCRENTGV
jgi:hypothetical protein